MRLRNSLPLRLRTGQGRPRSLRGFTSWWYRCAGAVLLAAAGTKVLGLAWGPPLPFGQDPLFGMGVRLIVPLAIALDSICGLLLLSRTVSAHTKALCSATIGLVYCWYHVAATIYGAGTSCGCFGPWTGQTLLPGGLGNAALIAFTAFMAVVGLRELWSGSYHASRSAHPNQGPERQERPNMGDAMRTDSNW